MASHSFMVICLVVLVLSSSPVYAVDCKNVLANLVPCLTYLAKFLPITPGDQCCKSINSIFGMDDINSLCQCLRLNPLRYGFLPSKAHQLPKLCNFSSFLPLVNCIIPSINDGTPLNPLAPVA
ncbi:non-specific lipid-transfer protein-like [Abeliophyllum distichum]|uniref:Non-specific lipid-transfer protein-like n=1 Tax=Abeliophyllum distichum TaxID=126358 RepID=A0ABD1QHW3_9LAMI